jgi:hypothetical protein
LEHESSVLHNNVASSRDYCAERIEAPNVTSITFKEDEGSFLAGIVAGLKTETNIVGFIEVYGRAVSAGRYYGYRVQSVTTQKRIFCHSG